MNTSSPPHLSPAQDYSLMMRQALIRQAQERIDALAASIRSAQLPPGWAGPGAVAFITSLRSHHPKLGSPAIDLESADRIIAGWRQG